MNDQSEKLIEDLQARGLIAQMTSADKLVEHLSSDSRSLYCGFDPTADSLHIGSLVPLLVLKRFQEAGHKPIVLLGGATGLIGDPSFKTQERKLNTPEIVKDWLHLIKKQISKFVDFSIADCPAKIVNNLDWIEKIDLLTFLRDIGKHFSINNMINKESVKQRLERDGQGISYTEFTYMLLQSYDFSELNRRHNCTIQIGGADQWGNIVGGVDLTRRLNGSQVFGLTLPLVTKSDGTKFGKTESGTIWLDSKKTSPYTFYQFWMNTSDADVYTFLKHFTYLSLDKIKDIETNDTNTQGRKSAQAILAEEVTRLVHGPDQLTAVKRITSELFSGDLMLLEENDLVQLQQDGLPSARLSLSDPNKLTLTSLLSDCGLAHSGREVKDALLKNAVFINGIPKGYEDNMQVSDCFSIKNALYGKFFIVKLGKKKYFLFELEK
ncbi:MAG: tyrosine--tRNA ligase [Cellvibrionales bacterium]|nr:tyrosine--tRNA ligase [Cellvibrionales bacterium]